MTKTLFAYGTLLDAEVRSVVLGENAHQVALTTASLSNHACLRLPDESYPVLTHQPGARTVGAIIENLTDELWARIDFFESDEYELAPIQVETKAGQKETWCYGAGKVMPGATEPWSLKAWQQQHRSGFLKMIGPYMALFGKVDLEAAEQLWDELQEKQR